MLDNKQVEPKYIVELLEGFDFANPEATKRATVVAGVFASHGSSQIEDALIRMLSIDDYHTKLQAVMAIADTPFNSMKSINALKALLSEDDELANAALLSLSSVSQKMNSIEVTKVNRDSIEDFIKKRGDEKLILDAIGNSGDHFFLDYLKEKISSTDLITKKPPFISCET